MEHKLTVSYYKPDRQGVFPTEDGCRFATEFTGKKEADCGLLFYMPDGTEKKIPASLKGKRGTLYGFEVKGEGLCECSYQYYDGKSLLTDAYARGIKGLEVWGDFEREKDVPRGRILADDFDWEEDEPLGIPYQDTIIYGLNVRAFTMHKSSGVKHKGTFEGIIEKIPYLKKLGITAIELMPAYEYEECMFLPQTMQSQSMQEAAKNCTLTMEKEKKLNCWGFTEAYYFAPKASYASEKPEISFKKMVKALHREGIEVMMQFYFPPGMKQTYMLEVLKYWVMEYHVDGFRLSGFQLPYTMLAQEPVLKETKIRTDYFPMQEIYGEEKPFYRNLASDNGNFKSDMRRFLKGDENLINQVITYHRKNPDTQGVINALADYDGFSLYDMVSYERKHNEANGEENRDGSDCNYSWNCGIEGESRKKAVTELRMVQLKNALCFLFLSQGVPFLFSGDEFGNTRFGYNNAYCQDNETGWVKWKENQFSRELTDFTCELIALRKKHSVLHQEAECKVMDTLGCGYPDISYHGTEAWRPDLSYISRMVGIMLCGKYVSEEETSLYLAYNMHWEKHELALPKLPKGMKWIRILDTSKEDIEDSLDVKSNKILTKKRSVSLYASVKDESCKEKEQSKKNSRKAGKKNERMETL